MKLELSRGSAQIFKANAKIADVFYIINAQQTNENDQPSYMEAKLWVIDGVLSKGVLLKALFGNKRSYTFFVSERDKLDSDGWRVLLEPVGEKVTGWLTA